MPQNYLMLLGGIIYLVQGSLHLAFTFFGSHFQARDQSLVKAMQSIAPGISAKTTMWRAWIGFNASHSPGAIVLGLFVIVLTLDFPATLPNSVRLSPTAPTTGGTGQRGLTFLSSPGLALLVQDPADRYRCGQRLFFCSHLDQYDLSFEIRK